MDNPKLGVDMAFKDDLVISNQGDIQLTADAANVKSAVIRRLNTPVGELLFHPGYGNPLYDILSDIMTESWKGKAITAIRQCLAQEPRISVDTVSVEIFPEDRIARFTIAYKLLDDPRSDNVVWEASLL
ncbi:hypothetical protein DCCM_3263 [Desulfocucumis palustris]|uniref:IraD/Gp25-like domain-containing protein n=1 Tax=Desulfocucumis palustris TaxID=1898651 RepID=A0A2L2XJP6_9FIRM|nr:GPW/gp25 family protein [Desulfocucumis palustris]GBF34151.1 hypothetical protein DCCM_3263 [Desulfocucumis palustris]